MALASPPSTHAGAGGAARGSKRRPVSRRRARGIRRAPARASALRLDRGFRALGDATRRAMIERLAKGPASIGELAEPFAMSFAGASKHVKVLERAGLVTREIDGRVHRCSVVPHALAALDSWLETYRAFWEGTLDELAKYVQSSAFDGGREEP